MILEKVHAKLPIRVFLKIMRYKKVTIGQRAKTGWKVGLWSIIQMLTFQPDAMIPPDRLPVQQYAYNSIIAINKPFWLEKCWKTDSIHWNRLRHYRYYISYWLWWLQVTQAILSLSIDLILRCLRYSDLSSLFFFTATAILLTEVFYQEASASSTADAQNMRCPALIEFTLFYNSL